MAHSGVPGASLLSSNSNYNPLGTFGTLLPDIGAVAGEIAAPGNPFSTAVFLGKGGFDLSQGNILGGLGNFAGAGAPFLLGAGGAGAGAASGGASGAGTGAAAAGPAAGGFGSSLSDFLANPSLAGAGNVASSAGSSISSGWNSLLNSIGLGSGTGAAGGAGADATAAYGGALPGSGAPFAMAPSAGATPLANTEALGLTPSSVATAAAGGAAPGAGGGILNTISSLTSQHPYLTLGAGLAGSQLLAPLLSKLTGSGLSTQEQSLLNNAQGAVSAENQLIGSETSGVLPPGAQASVEDALNSDIANIRSRYAATGQSGSAGEEQDIANARSQSAASQFGIAQQATNTGLTALGLTSNIYDTLVQDQLNKQQQLQAAFSGFFNALGTGTAIGQAKAAA